METEEPTRDTGLCGYIDGLKGKRNIYNYLLGAYMFVA